jgi:2-polyprenyl-3-methyl-5-hydroxy-6-metoxy-1,4-benzoquinol methylase
MSLQELGYYDNPRLDAVPRLPRPIGTVLDVGCGAGGVAATLRAAGATRIVGVEPHGPSAKRARTVLDEVFEGTVEEVLAGGAVAGPYDTIVAYDVLEHVVDPLPVVAGLRELAAPGGRLHVSVPNARHFSLAWDLFVRGTFGYTDWGHRDRTHLRWFTRRDLETLVRDGGWSPVKTDANVLGRNQLVDRVTFGRLREFLALQYQVLAVAGRQS